jgi:arginase family enzyme
MTRYGAMFGPDMTFLGVDRCDLGDPGSFATADVVIVGAPFDGGTSHRPGARFGPQAIRSTDCLPHDGSRPHLALRVDALRCRELPIAGVDVVEVSPPFDHAEITAMLANRVVLEALSGLAAARRDVGAGVTFNPATPLLAGRLDGTSRHNSREEGTTA